MAKSKGDKPRHDVGVVEERRYVLALARRPELLGEYALRDASILIDAVARSIYDALDTLVGAGEFVTIGILARRVGMTRNALCQLAEVYDDEADVGALR